MVDTPDPREHDDEDEDELRQFARELFRPDPNDAPRDVVPGRPMTRADYEAFSRLRVQKGPWREVRPEPELVSDVDGGPLAVANQTDPVTVYFGGYCLMPEEAEELGIAVGELPGVLVISADRPGPTPQT